MASKKGNQSFDMNGSNSTVEKQRFICEMDRQAEVPRESWGSRFEFLLAIVGFTVGVSSIWRFPIVCVRNGGGAFLLPFCFILILIGGPMYYLEINLGQFTGKGPCRAFEYCQLFKGTGYLMVTMVLCVLWYILTIMSWILYYLYSSFSAVLPWSTCNNEWNTVLCREIYDRGEIFNASSFTNKTSIENSSLAQNVNPAFEFWTYNVLGKSSGLEDMGNIQIHLVITLIISWLVTNLALIKGVKSLGKVVYFTALFPYVLLTILLVRGVTLDGSTDGLVFFLKFDSSKLTDYQVWLDASVQVFYSLGPLWGSVISLSSHNKFNQHTFKDTLIVCITDVFTAIYAALVVFSVIGFMAKESGVPVEVLATSSGPGLAFIAYPTACSLMPFPQLWAVLFFIMMLLVFLDSAFGMLETVVESLRDLLPARFSKHRIVVNFCFAILMILAGLVYTTNGGIYLFQLMDWYVSAFALLIGAFLEVTSLSLIYGIDRFSKDMKLMTGRDVSRLARFLYCIVIPVTSFITFILILSRYSAPNYGDGYIYKPYAIAIGFFVGLLPVAVFVIIGVYAVGKQDGSLIQKVKSSMKASDTWGPKDRKVAELYKMEPYLYERSVFGRLKKNLMGDHDTPWI